MIEPLNPTEPNYVDVDLLFNEAIADVERERIEAADENDVVELRWRNASVTMRAGSLRALLGRRDLLDA